MIFIKSDAKTTAEHRTCMTEERQTLLSKIGENYFIETITERFFVEHTLNFPEPNHFNLTSDYLKMSKWLLY
jgi:hypothetical protein